MAENCTRKLIVEVYNARNLMPKDGQGTASAYAVVDFDGQRRRTKTICRDLNPQWDEKLEFNVNDDASMASETLELNLHNDKNSGKRSNFLGKVKISGNCFMKAAEDVPLVYYPLEKRSVFSQVKGEIGLKVSYLDEKAVETAEKSDAPPEAAEAEKRNLEEKEKKNLEAEEEKTEEANSKAEQKPATDDSKEEEKPAAIPPPPPNPEKSEHVELQSKLFHKISTGNFATPRAAFDLVDQMPFLYIRMVKAKISNPDPEASYHGKLVIGTHTITTKSEPANRDWDQVFAFDKESLNSSSLEISLTCQKKHADKKGVDESSCGRVSFDLQEVPKRMPPDSPLAPQWYSLEGDDTPGNDVMLSVWVGTQADEAFQEAWQSDSGGLIPETRAKVYLSPKLWYLRVTVIQTQDLQLGSESEPRPRSPELYVKAQLGPQIFKTSRTSAGFGSSNPTWDEDLIFVAAEPFDPFMTITVEDFTSGVSVGHAKVQVATLDKRTDDKTEAKSKWFNLVGDENSKPYAGRIHVRACLEGGYHVLDEPAHVTSDVRPTANHLSRRPIGLLELGIRGANNLVPIKTKDGNRGTTDSYVVAKYGPKWARTRTILDRFNPRWNEQYTWEVYDPCTVLTIGVFDNGRYKHDELIEDKDVRLGKLRVRLSTLDTNRVYVWTYPLTVLLPGGAKKMGEIEIALRFTCSSWMSLIQSYANPLLPRMHYVKPLGLARQEALRHNAMKIVTTRLARSEPALDQGVVQFMLDSNTHVWSMRRSKANWFRAVSCLSRVVAFVSWLDRIRRWSHPPTTVFAHIVLVAIVICPSLIMPTIFMYAFFVLMIRYPSRPHISAEMDPRLSCVDAVGSDELDEEFEFDRFPATRSADHVRARYDRLRALAGRAQTLLGEVASQGERLESLFNWKDPRATSIFGFVCLFASMLFYAVPFKIFVLGFGFYYFRHPRFRDEMPSIAVNFFGRLPPKSDRIL